MHSLVSRSAHDVLLVTESQSAPEQPHAYFDLACRLLHKSSHGRHMQQQQQQHRTSEGACIAHHSNIATAHDSLGERLGLQPMLCHAQPRASHLASSVVAQVSDLQASVWPGSLLAVASTATPCALSKRCMDPPSLGPICSLALRCPCRAIVGFRSPQTLGI